MCLSTILQTAQDAAACRWQRHDPTNRYEVTKRPYSPWPVPSGRLSGPRHHSKTDMNSVTLCSRLGRERDTWADLNGVTVYGSPRHLKPTRPVWDTATAATRTGYNAAILCRRLGDRRVATVDVDSDLMVLAETRLAGLGYHPSVATVDAAVEVPGGPYDRIIATVGVRRLPYPWVRRGKARRPHPGQHLLRPCRGRHLRPHRSRRWHREWTGAHRRHLHAHPRQRHAVHGPPSRRCRQHLQANQTRRRRSRRLRPLPPVRLADHEGHSDSINSQPLRATVRACSAAIGRGRMSRTGSHTKAARKICGPSWRSSTPFGKHTGAPDENSSD